MGFLGGTAFEEFQHMPEPIRPCDHTLSSSLLSFSDFPPALFEPSVCSGGEKRAVPGVRTTRLCDPGAFGAEFSNFS